jgi:thiol:disulfide interchange protein
MRRIGVLVYWTADDAEGQARLAAFTRVCVPKIRFCNIGDEDRQGQVAM